MAIPTWKDTYYSTTASVLEFTVQDTNGAIFRGQAQKPSSLSAQRIRVNSVCEPYLSPLFDDDITKLAGSHTAHTRDTFNIYTGTTKQASYDLVWCHDHSISSLSTNDILNDDIDGLRGGNQFDVTSTLTSSGTTTTFTRSQNPQGCGDYAIYYLNLKGGWDSYLIRGKVTRTSSLNVTETSLYYDNNTLQSSKGRHVNNDDTWVINTGYMTDRQSRKFALNVFSSPLVYLHDLMNDTVTPVMITDTSTEVRTHSPGSPVAYAVNVTRAGETITQ